jgi:formate dehydrogenase major subunit
VKLTRRKFIKITGSACVGAAVAGLGFDLAPIQAHAQSFKLKQARESKTICPYCAVGCGAIVHTSLSGNHRVINIEGDPDNVINRGALCSKGSAMYQFVENENRLTQPMYRAPYSKKWKTVSWDWALDKIAKRIQQTRDAGFIHKNDAGDIVNRVTNMASMGSAAMDNEECWLYQTLLRSLGMVYIEHQARL